MTSSRRQHLVRRRGRGTPRDTRSLDGSWVTTGVTGMAWRASVTPWGDVIPWGDEHQLEWYIAASDRWYRPAHETAVRSERIDGTAVVETRVRIPGGDAVQRVFSVSDHGGLTIVEITNESASPIAVAFTRRDLLTERPIVDQPIEGIDLPDRSIVVPIGHRATARVAISHSALGPGPLPDAIPTWRQVVSGWLLVAQRLSRLELPEGRLGSAVASRVVAERCELALGGLDDRNEDPIGFLLGVEELSRAGEPVAAWIPEVASAVAEISRRGGWGEDRALEAAGRLLWRTGEVRAVRDLDAIIERRVASGMPIATVDSEPPRGVRVIAWSETRLAHGSEILPYGFHEPWIGVDFEVHGVPIGSGSARCAALSYAIRWHGARPAVLWEVRGGPVELTAPAVAPQWSSSEPSGEALWPSPVIDRSFS
jgi:hypothetical protein